MRKKKQRGFLLFLFSIFLFFMNIFIYIHLNKSVAMNDFAWSSFLFIVCPSLVDVLFFFLLFFSLKVHRLIIINDQRHILGILSMSDLMRFLISTSARASNTNNKFIFFIVVVILGYSRTDSSTSNSNFNIPVFESEPMES